MPRVEIDLPDRFPFTTEIPIRVDDMNYGGHLGNDRVLALAQEARVRLLRAHGWKELDIEGTGLIMVDAAVVYRAEGQAGMLLRVEVAPADVRSRGLDLLYRMTDVASGLEIARVKTGIVFFDYTARKVVHMPEAFRRAVCEADGPG
jgi:acyl-CoA thioester hydrolase